MVIRLATLREAPNLWQMDLGLGKHIPLLGVRLQFRSELFNILNRAQYGLPLADFVLE
jgi:hypothetical protein